MNACLWPASGLPLACLRLASSPFTKSYLFNMTQSLGGDDKGEGGSKFLCVLGVLGGEQQIKKS